MRPPTRWSFNATAGSAILIIVCSPYKVAQEHISLSSPAPPFVRRKAALNSVVGSGYASSVSGVFPLLTRANGAHGLTEWPVPLKGDDARQPCPGLSSGLRKCYPASSLDPSARLPAIDFAHEHRLGIVCSPLRPICALSIEEEDSTNDTN